MVFENFGELPKIDSKLEFARVFPRQATRYVFNIRTRDNLLQVTKGQTNEAVINVH